MVRWRHSRPSRARELVFTMRLGLSERSLLDAAATRREEYLSEYVRRTCIEAVRRELAEEPTP